MDTCFHACPPRLTSALKGPPSRTTFSINIWGDLFKMHPPHLHYSWTLTWELTGEEEIH